MSAKQLLRLGLVFLALLVLWGATALARRRESAPPAGDSFRLPRMTRSNVDTIVVKRAGDTTVLARTDTTWTVNGHPVAPGLIGDLFAAFSDTTPSAELVAERRSSQAGLGVDSASGTRARVRGGGKTLLDLVIGRRSPDLAGGYLRHADQDATYMVRGRMVELLDRSSDDWRDHRIVSVPADSIGGVEVTRGARHYALRRSGNGWTLTPGGPADSSRAAEVVGAWTAVEASGFATAAQADSARFNPPDIRVRLLRTDGTPRLALLFDSTASGFWVKSDTGRTIFRMEPYEISRIAPADSSLRPRKAAPTGRTPPAKAPAGK
jgi:hypothetical protein